MKRLILILSLFSCLLFADRLNVAVAANVSYAIKPLIEIFNKKYPDIKVTIFLGSSGKLSAQIRNGAPFDIFLSADIKYPKALYNEGYAITEPKVYAEGALAIFSIKKRDFSKGVYICLDKNIKSIAIANPKTAPYGKAALEALKRAKILKKIKDKLIYAESISQAVAYSIKAADLGFISKSALKSPKLSEYKKGVNWIEVDSSLYEPIKQGVVILKEAKDKKEAKLFYNFLFLKEAKRVFRDYGYSVKID